MKQTICTSLLFVLLLSSLVQGNDFVHWTQINPKVYSMLQSQDTDLIELAKQQADYYPQTAEDLLFKLNIMLRAGLNKEAAKTIRQLRSVSEQINPPCTSRIYYACYDQYKAYEAAQALVETFAEKLGEISLNNRLIEHFERSGWSFEEIDSWLVQQGQKAKSLQDAASGNNAKPDLLDTAKLYSKLFWIRQRLAFLADNRKESLLAGQLQQALRNDPSDTYTAIAYLELLSRLPSDRQNKFADFHLNDFYKAQSAIEAKKIASLFEQIEAWEEAKDLYLQALEIPLTNEEAKFLTQQCQRAYFGDESKIRFRRNLLYKTADCFLKLDNPQDAQEYLEQAQNLEKKHNFRTSLYFAGRVDERSGATAVEKGLEEQEQSASKDPKYWLKRAEYYEGRNNAKKQEEAYLHVLDLAAPAPRKRGKGSYDIRARALWRYASLLHKQDRKKEAYNFLLKEIETAPSDSVSSHQAISYITRKFSQLIDPNDNILWNWLDSQPVWNHTEKSLLIALLKNSSGAPFPMPGMMGPNPDKKTTPKKLEKYFQRAEQLIVGRDASRAKVLGQIMTMGGRQYSKRAIPMLQYAIKNATDKRIKQSAEGTLFHLYLKYRDWEKAESMFASYSGRLTLKEQPHWLGRIAIAAAWQDDKENALRIFKQVANFNLRPVDLISELASVNMKDELIGFYEAVEEKLPNSVAPQLAFEILEEK